MDTRAAYRELLRIDASVTYTEKMSRAAARVDEARRKSFEVATRSRTEAVATNGTTVVVAICDGYASDIAAAWGESPLDTVFGLYDRRSSTVSLRRSPVCELDVSRLAERLGGGGHPAAAGFRPRDLAVPNTAAILRDILSALQSSGA